MPIAAIIVGVIMLDLAFRGTEHEFAAQLGKDFGQGTKFWAWAGAIGVIGAAGYVPKLEKVANLFLALVLLVIVLVHGGLFQQLAALAIRPPAPAPAIPLTKYKDPGGSSSSSSSSSSGGSGSTISSIAKIAEFAVLA